MINYHFIYTYNVPLFTSISGYCFRREVVLAPFLKFSKESSVKGSTHLKKPLKSRPPAEEALTKVSAASKTEGERRSAKARAIC